MGFGNVRSETVSGGVHLGCARYLRQPRGLQASAVRIEWWRAVGCHLEQLHRRLLRYARVPGCCELVFGLVLGRVRHRTLRKDGCLSWLECSTCIAMQSSCISLQSIHTIETEDQARVVLVDWAGNLAMARPIAMTTMRMHCFGGLGLGLYTIGPGCTYQPTRTPSAVCAEPIPRVATAKMQNRMPAAGDFHLQVRVPVLEYAVGIHIS